MQYMESGKFFKAFVWLLVYYNNINILYYYYINENMQLSFMYVTNII